MAKIPLQECNCEDWPCCEHADSFALTEQDAIVAYEDDYDRYLNGPIFSDDPDDCNHCCSSPCICDQLHDMAVEDRLGGTGYED